MQSSISQEQVEEAKALLRKSIEASKLLKQDVDNLTNLAIAVGEWYRIGKDESMSHDEIEMAVYQLERAYEAYLKDILK